MRILFCRISLPRAWRRTIELYSMKRLRRLDVCDRPAAALRVMRADRRQRIDTMILHIPLPFNILWTDNNRSMGLNLFLSGIRHIVLLHVVHNRINGDISRSGETRRSGEVQGWDIIWCHWNQCIILRKTIPS